MKIKIRGVDWLPIGGFVFSFLLGVVVPAFGFLMLTLLFMVQTYQILKLNWKLDNEISMHIPAGNVEEQPLVQSPPAPLHPPLPPPQPISSPPPSMGTYQGQPVRSNEASHYQPPPSQVVPEPSPEPEPVKAIDEKELRIERLENAVQQIVDALTQPAPEPKPKPKGRPKKQNVASEEENDQN